MGEFEPFRVREGAPGATPQGKDKYRRYVVTLMIEQYRGVATGMTMMNVV
jgi:hypothetical protein